MLVLGRDPDRCFTVEERPAMVPMFCSNEIFDGTMRRVGSRNSVPIQSKQTMRTSIADTILSGACQLVMPVATWAYCNKDELEI